jgi:hypothetical protein
MALDVFHQVLKRLSDTAGGNPRQMVSIVDVLKQEKLFGSIDMILNKFHTEGWIAEAPTKDHVYVTTWGIDEVRRAEAPGSTSGTGRGPKAEEPKNAAALREAAGKARELAELLMGFAAGESGTAAQRKAKAKKALAAAAAAVEEALE